MSKSLIVCTSLFIAFGESARPARSKRDSLVIRIADKRMHSLCALFVFKTKCKQASEGHIPFRYFHPPRLLLLCCNSMIEFYQCILKYFSHIITHVCNQSGCLSVSRFEGQEYSKQIVLYYVYFMMKRLLLLLVGLCQPKSSRSKFHPPCAQDHEKQHRLLTSDTTPHSRLLLKDLIDSIHCASVFYGDHLHHDPHTIFLLLLLRMDDVTLGWGERKKKSSVH